MSSEIAGRKCEHDRIELFKEGSAVEMKKCGRERTSAHPQSNVRTSRDKKNLWGEKVRRKVGAMGRKESFTTSALRSQFNLNILSSSAREEDRTSPVFGMRHTCSDAAVNAASSAKPPDPHGANALYDVSQEFMRVSGYVPRFKWLLSNGSATIPETPTESEAKSNWVRAAAKLSQTNNPLLDDPNALDKNNCKGENDGQLSVGQKQGGRESTPLIQRRIARAQNFCVLWKSGKEIYNTKRQLMQKRIRFCDWSVLFGMIGILLTVMDAELVAAGTTEKAGVISNTLKSVTVASTILLTIFITKYHWYTAKILLITSGADDWRVTVQFGRLIQCCIELVICVICPLPGSIQMNWQLLSTDNHRSLTHKRIPLDALLSILMFLRSYLICRFVALHNRRYQDPATRSIAALNHVNVDFPFVLKTMMHERPLQVLVTFAVSFWVVMSWLLTQCERHNGVSAGNQYLNSVWLVVVTFTSIGYGDLVPQTYCGRALAITTGIMGAGVSSALIAVISRRMELTRAEKQVNQFINDSKLSRIKKDTAAAILQHTWFIYRYKRSASRIDQHKIRVHQRKFLNAINQFRNIKWNQRRLQEQACNLLDLTKLQGQMQQSLSSLKRGQDTLATQIKQVEMRIDSLTALHKAHMDK